MSPLLPSTPDTSAVDESDPRVLGLDEDAAEEVLAALSSDTARTILTTLHEEPAHPAAVADDVDTSIQNVQYHLEQLEAAEVIEPIDTVYSEKGREMTVYGPADRPLVVLAGNDDDKTRIRDLLVRFLGALGILAVVSFVVEALVGDLSILAEEDVAPADEPVDFEVAEEPVPEPDTVPEAEPGLAEAIGLPPGALVFLGGVVVLLVIVGIRYWQHHR